MAVSPSHADSALFTPISINNGKIQLAHRVILAPLTRNRGTPLKRDSTAEDPNRVWLPNEMMAEYYGQRASKGGLMITEGVPPSLEVCVCVFLVFFFLSVQYALGRGSLFLVGGWSNGGVETEMIPMFRGIVRFGRSLMAVLDVRRPSFEKRQPQK